MRFLVTPLRRRGRRIPRRQRIEPFEGELVVFFAHDHDQTMRRQAVLQSQGERHVNATTILGPLYDPTLIAGGGEALLFRGLSLEEECEVAQEWWVRVLP